MLVAFSPYMILAKQISDVPALDLSGATILMLGVAAIVCIGISVFLANELFFRVWFLYLNALPAETRVTAEASLKQSMTPSTFGKRYKTLRSKLLRGGD